MLTRLNLDLDSGLIQIPLPALCVRLPKQQNPLTFDWRGQPFQVRCMLLGDMNDGQGSITPDESAAGILKVATGLDAADNGKFYDWQGNELPW